MPKSYSGYKALSRLKACCEDYLQRKKQLEKELENIRINPDLTQQAKQRMASEIQERLKAEQAAGKKIISDIRQKYEAGLQESKSVISVSESGGVSLLCAHDIGLLTSLDYLPMDQSDWVRLASSIDTETSPGLALAIRKKAEAAGYELRGFCTSPAEDLKEFDRLSGMAEQIFNPSGQYADSVDLWSIDYLQEIGRAAESHYGFNQDGTRKPKTIEAVPIPDKNDFDAVIAQGLQEQVDAQSDKAKQLSLEDIMDFDPDAGNVAARASAIAAVSAVKADTDDVVFE